jgi:hypothetical protein
MLDRLAIEVGPSRFARALGAVLVGALAIMPAVTPEPPVASKHPCELSRATVRPRAEIRTRAHELNPRYLQRELGPRAAPAR